MNAGDKDAKSGMAMAIYVSIERILGEGLEDKDKQALEPMKKLSYVIADGVVANLEQDSYFAWFAGLTKVFTTDWKPATPDGVNLQNALIKYLKDKPIPDELKGVLP